MLRSLIVLCVALLPFAISIQIHKHMTEEEILKTFQTAQDSVPKYEVVPVFHTLHKRDTSGNATAIVKVNAFDKEISLYLKPTEGLLASLSTPVWIVNPDPAWPERTRYTRIKHPFANIGQTYQDPSKMSALVTYIDENGHNLIHGNLLSDLVIRPLPLRLRDLIPSRETRSPNDSPSNLNENGEDLRQTHHHVVFERKERDANYLHDKIKVIKRYGKNFAQMIRRPPPKGIPHVIYPEILVIVDSSLFAVLGRNIQETTRYILAFWNAVDLRYRLLSEPTIRLNIAGIIISVKHGGTPYLDNNRRGTTEIDADKAITAMSHYFYREAYRFRFRTYDMAVAMTRLDLCNVEYNGICDTSTLGYAYEWGACNRSHVDMNTEAVAIVEDNGGYQAIIPTAHEVAHLMGVPHDGIRETMNCPGYNGFIMSTSLHFGENAFQWSNCSLQYFHDFFSAPDSKCIFNKPKLEAPLPRLLPGTIKTLDEQCEKVMGTKACHYDGRVCTALECYVPGTNGWCKAVSSAAEGSSCGDNSYCINGHCISQNATHVPYTLSTTVAPFKPGFLGGKFYFPPRQNVTQNKTTDNS